MVMKLVTHRTYCTDCKCLVMGVQEKNGNRLKLLCPKCKRPLWTYSGYTWRYLKKVD
jgi:RNase P subunit RPR2